MLSVSCSNAAFEYMYIRTHNLILVVNVHGAHRVSPASREYLVYIPHFIFLHLNCVGRLWNESLHLLLVNGPSQRSHTESNQSLWSFSRGSLLRIAFCPLLPQSLLPMDAFSTFEPSSTSKPLLHVAAGVRCVEL